MRILGFSKKWAKLGHKEFSTFRFPRRDRDWEIGEQVQIVIKPRHKDRQILGIAEIINKELRSPDAEFPRRDYLTISDEEARIDGFEDYEDMWHWILSTYGAGDRLMSEPMNKLTLKWL